MILFLLLFVHLKDGSLTLKDKGKGLLSTKTIYTKTQSDIQTSKLKQAKGEAE